MRELNTPSLARALVNAASGQAPNQLQLPNASRDKGKGRAKPPPMNLSPSPALGSAVQQTAGPLTPPPPYLRRRASHHQQTSPPRSRGSSTVASIRTRPSNADLRNAPSDLPPGDQLERRRSSVATVVPPSPLRTRPRSPAPPLPKHQTTPGADTETTDPDDESESDDHSPGRQTPAEGDDDSDPQQLTRDSEASSLGHADSHKMTARSAAVRKGSSADLARFLVENEPPEGFQQVGSSSWSASLPSPPSSPRVARRRPSNLGSVLESRQENENPAPVRQPRSQLMAKSASRDDSRSARGLIDFLESHDPPGSPRRAKRQRSQTDVRSALPHSGTNDSLASAASNDSVTTTLLSDRASPRSSSRQGLRLSPRPASMALLPNFNMRELAEFLREDAAAHEQRRQDSESQPEAEGEEPQQTASSDAPRPPSSSLEADVERPESRVSEVSQEQVNVLSRRKRWSGMLDSVLRNTSGGGSSGGGSSPALNMPAHASSAPDLVESVHQGSPSADQHLQQSEPEASTSAPPPLTRPAPPTRKTSTQKLRAAAVEEDDQDQQSTSDGPPVVDPASVTTPSAKPEKHSASSAAPLEYVKLARSKGTRLIKTIETSKRTFLAVLCGESGERIELFTVSTSPPGLLSQRLIVCTISRDPRMCLSL